MFPCLTDLSAQENQASPHVAVSWQAAWVGGEAATAKLGWLPSTAIKVSGEDSVIFIRTLHIPEDIGIGLASIKIAASDTFTLFVNDKRRGRGASLSHYRDLYAKYWLKAGDNILKVKVASKETGMVSLWLNMEVFLDNGQELRFEMDDQWRAISAAPAEVASSPLLATEIYSLDHAPLPMHEAPRSILLRKNFPIEGKVRQAHLAISGLGSYVPYLNGQRLGKSEFAPGWTDYRQRVLYQSYEVGDLLEKGENVIGALLGNAWWSSGLGWGSHKSYSAGPLRLRAQLRIEYEDGHSQYLLSDSSWQYAPSPILENSLYHGESYDARLEQKGWNQPGFDAQAWPQAFPAPWPGRMEPSQGPEIEVRQQISPQEIIPLGQDSFLLDFGQNIAGRLRLRAKASKGTRVQFRFSEILDSPGQIHTHNLRSARATDSYTFKGEGLEEWSPSFTYHGFRYVEVTGLKKVKRKNFQMEVLHSAVKERGRFTCADPLLNQIHENAVRSFRSNLYSVITDCPQRDERLGWLGDAQAMAASACYDLDMASFFRKWMQDLEDGQNPHGYIRDVNPPMVLKDEPARPGWGDAAVILPWTVYQFYGDIEILRSSFPMMQAWVDYLNRQGGDSLYVWRNSRGTSFGFGDWMAPEHTDKRLIAAAFQAYSTQLLAKTAQVLGRDTLAYEYHTRFAQIRDRFHARYYRPDSSCYLGGSQTAQLLPLAFDLVPDSLKEGVVKHLVKNVTERENHLSTGFLGTAFLLPLLSANGQQDLAYEVARQRSYPSWGYMIEQGATAMWERWNADQEGPHTNSRNHFALGPIAEWLYGSVAGIQAVEAFPGFERCLIAPKPPKDLTWAEASIKTHGGEIRSKWQRKGQTWTLHIEIPAEGQAEVHIPLEAFQNPHLRSGKHTLWTSSEGFSDIAHSWRARKEAGLIALMVGPGKHRFEVRESN